MAAGSNRSNATLAGFLSSPELLRRLLISLAILVWIVVILWVAWHIARAIVLMAIGGLLAFTIYPIVKLLNRFMPRPLAIGIVYVAIFGALVVLLYFVVITVINQVTSLIGYLESFVNSNGSSQFKPILDFLGRFGITASELKSYGQQLVGQLQTVVAQIIPLVSNILSFYVSAVLVALFSIYFLLYGPRIAHWLRTKTPEGQQGGIDFFLSTVDRVIGSYIRGNAFLAIVISALTGISIAFIGVPFPFLLAVFSFVMEFIPVIGVYLTAVAIVVVALTQGLVTGLLALIFVIILQTLENNILSPRILGQSVGINPIVTIFALIAGTELFGIVGALFATPVAGVLQAIVIVLWNHWKATHPDQFSKEADKGRNEDQQ